MTGLPLHNARLSQVQAKGSSERYDRAATAGAVKWQGTADAYAVDRIVEQVVGGDLNLLHRTVLIVPANVGDVEPEDSITYTPTGGSAVTRKVQTIDSNGWDGMLTLHLWDR